jgi:hypothetical protein
MPLRVLPVEARTTKLMSASLSLFSPFPGLNTMCMRHGAGEEALHQWLLSISE